VTLVLLTVTAAQARAFALALAAGEPGEELSAALWADYAGQAAECFLCAEPIMLPAFTQLYPDKAPATMVAAPLCGECAALPPMVRGHRGLRLMRTMSGVAR
jgi:hypothetical protein